MNYLPAVQSALSMYSCNIRAVDFMAKFAASLQSEHISVVDVKDCRTFLKVTTNLGTIDLCHNAEYDKCEVSNYRQIESLKANIRSKFK